MSIGIGDHGFGSKIWTICFPIVRYRFNCLEMESSKHLPKLSIRLFANEWLLDGFGYISNVIKCDVYYKKILWFEKYKISNILHV